MTFEPQTAFIVGLVQIVLGIVLAQVPPNDRDSKIICMGVTFAGLIPIIVSAIYILARGTP